MCRIISLFSLKLLSSITPKYLILVTSDDNRSEFVNFLADFVKANSIRYEGKHILSTEQDHAVYMLTTTEMMSILCFGHEKADTRFFLHAKDAVDAEHVNYMMIINTDIVVLAIALLNDIQVSEL